MAAYLKNEYPLEASTSDGILRITLNDPAKRNALSEAMLAGMHEVLDQANEDPGVRVVIVGANGNVYCAGHHLAELTEGRKNADGGKEYFARIMGLCSSMMQKIVNLRKPVIADVRGVATAAGCQLVASCDLAYATADSRFSTPGVNIGLFCSTPMVALSRNVGGKHAMEMLLTGDMVDAARAAEIGLINRVAEADEIDAVIDEVASKISSKSMSTLKIGKEAFYHQRQLPLGEAYDYCSNVMVENMLKLDAEEGINAFLEKRQPRWKDQ